MQNRSDFLDTARVAAALLRDPALAGHWSRPSALPEFSVAGLAGHLAFQVLAVPELLSGPIPPEPTVPLAEHYRQVEWVDAPPEHELNVRIRDSGEQTAAGGPAALAAAVEAAIAELTEVLPSAIERPVRVKFWGPWALTLEDLLLTRMMELVVHADDLAVSIGVPTPEFPARPVESVLALLVQLAARRRGVVPVLRALTRAERAPGDITAF